MGFLIDGQWNSDNRFPASRSGDFQRAQSAFRNWVTPDGSAGPSGEGGFVAEPGRYHLYVSLACPWAHRTLIMRALKGLGDAIGVSVVHWLMRDDGWTFEDDDGVIADTVNGRSFMHEIYTLADGGYSGRVTVPVLWDKMRVTIVNNESSEIIRMLNNAFDGVGAAQGDYYPAALREEIDRVNARVYDTLNNGVYKCGFARSQAAYDKAIGPLFETLDWLEALLGDRRFVAGDVFTEADIRLFTTLIRFDAVYVGHFKCNLRCLREYPNLWAYTRQIYQMGKVRPTVNFEHIKQHYYASHLTVNPSGIVPAGPIIDYDAPHGRS
jgi:putative glutathione S-transferase